MSLIHVLIGPRHGLKYHSPEAENSRSKKVMVKEVKAAALGIECPIFHLWVTNGKEGVYGMEHMY